MRVGDLGNVREYQKQLLEGLKKRQPVQLVTKTENGKPLPEGNLYEKIEGKNGKTFYVRREKGYAEQKAAEQAEIRNNMNAAMRQLRETGAAGMTDEQIQLEKGMLEAAKKRLERDTAGYLAYKNKVSDKDFGDLNYYGGGLTVDQADADKKKWGKLYHNQDEC